MRISGINCRPRIRSIKVTAYDNFTHPDFPNELRPLCSFDYSHHRYHVLHLINGISATQIELESRGIPPRRAIEQTVEYKNDPGSG